MTTSSGAWHADDAMLHSYVHGTAGIVASSSLEQHLVGCGSCRQRVGSLVDPTPLADAWAGIEETVQAPKRGYVERVLARAGLPESDALLLVAAPALRQAWLAGTLLALLFATLAALASDSRGALVFLVVAPLAPVAGVALAYGPDADECYEVTVSTSYSPLRLVLLRTSAVLATSLPAAMVGGFLLPGPAWTAVAWLLPALAGVALTLAGSTWTSVTRAGVAVAVAWAATATLAAGSGVRSPTAAIEGLLLPLYLAIGITAAFVFWRRASQLNLMGGSS